MPSVPTKRLPRLAAFDLDGTLLTSSYQLSDRTRDALHALSQAGVTIVLATGRPVDAVVGVLDGHHAHYIVGSNGRELYRYATDEQLRQEDFPLELALEAGRALRQHIDGVRLALFTDLAALIEPGWEAIIPEPGPMTPVDDALVAPGSIALRLGAFHPDRRAVTFLDAARGVLPDGLDAAVSGLDSLDVGPAGSNKAIGVRRLAEELGIEKDDVIAFGDNLNDHELLEWAGRGVAVANADPATLALADEITGSNDDDGVAWVLERLL